MDQLPGSGHFEEAEVFADGAWRRLADQHLRAPYQHEVEGTDVTDDRTEYVIPVQWLYGVDLDNGYWESGMFANRHSACQLTHAFTRDRLVAHMGLQGDERI